MDGVGKGSKLEGLWGRLRERKIRSAVWGAVGIGEHLSAKVTIELMQVLGEATGWEGRILPY